MARMTDSLAYITVRTPFGFSEEFLLNELSMIHSLGVTLDIIPRSPQRFPIHLKAKRLAPFAHNLPLLNLPIFARLFLSAVKDSTKLRQTFSLICNSRNMDVFVRNLAVLPKCHYLTEYIDWSQVAHIHAGWGTTPATMALLLSRMLGISWSMTLHRGDIVQNNLLLEKFRSALFVRCISNQAREMALRIVGARFRDKTVVLHLGTEVPTRLNRAEPPATRFSIVSTGNLIPVKGHAFLLKALAILKSRHKRHFNCRIFGDGPLKPSLVSSASSLGLGEQVSFHGSISHEKLLQVYANGDVSAFVLPSTITPEGEHEGIPVALMEAMAYSIPIIATDTGAIGELVRPGAGELVPPSNPEKLANALINLMDFPHHARKLGVAGSKVVHNEFNLSRNSIRLLRHMGFEVRDKLI